MKLWHLVCAILIALIFIGIVIKEDLTKSDNVAVEVKKAYVKSFRDGFMIGWFEREYYGLEDVKKRADIRSKKYEDWIEEINARRQE